MIDYWNMDEYVFKLAHLKATNLFFVTNFSRTINVYPYLQIVSFLIASCHVFLIDYSKNFEQIYRIQFTCVIDVLLHCQYTYINIDNIIINQLLIVCHLENIVED